MGGGVELGVVTGVPVSPTGAAHVASVALIGGAGATLHLVSSGALLLLQAVRLIAVRSRFKSFVSGLVGAGLAD